MKWNGIENNVVAEARAVGVGRGSGVYVYVRLRHRQVGATTQEVSSHNHRSSVPVVGPADSRADHTSNSHPLRVCTSKKDLFLKKKDIFFLKNDGAWY